MTSLGSKRKRDSDQLFTVLLRQKGASDIEYGYFGSKKQAQTYCKQFPKASLPNQSKLQVVSSIVDFDLDPPEGYAYLIHCRDVSCHIASLIDNDRMFSTELEAKLDARHLCADLQQQGNKNFVVTVKAHEFH